MVSVVLAAAVAALAVAVALLWWRVRLLTAALGAQHELLLGTAEALERLSRALSKPRAEYPFRISKPTLH